MDDSLSTIAALTKSGYRLTLYRSASGKYWADLERGWLLKRRVRVDLDRERFEHAKRILGAGVTRKRISDAQLARLRGT
jgi:hypothetical protein